MRFTEFSIPDSTEWMEKSDILFLLDCCNRDTPFVSRTIVGDYERIIEDPYNLILDRIHPEDLMEFNKLVDGKSSRPAHYKLRILDRSNQTQLFSFHKLKIGNGRSREMLLAISKKRYSEPVLTEVSVSW